MLYPPRLDLVSASGIRRFFELIATTDGVISLGVGEPDFPTPNHIGQAAIRSIEKRARPPTPRTPASPSCAS